MSYTKSMELLKGFRFSFFNTWLAVTAAYWGFIFLNPEPSAAYKTLTYGVGLFVPLGPYTLELIKGMLASEPLWALLPVAVLVLSFYFVDKYTRRVGITGAMRLLTNLVVLMAVTLITDIILFKVWMSFFLFLGVTDAAGFSWGWHF